MLKKHKKFLKHLKQIENLYNRASSSFEKQLYSKICILEMGGWIEEALDQVFAEAAKRKLKTQKLQRYEKEHIKKNYGFTYSDNIIQKLLIPLKGLEGSEKFDLKIDSGKIAVLDASLRNLKAMRDQMAHTQSGISGTGATPYQAPSATIGSYAGIVDGIREIKRCLR